MHRLNPNTAKSVYLSSLVDGTVFVAHLGNGHGHQSGIVFGGRCVLILSGPEQFSTFQMGAHDKTAVVPCSEWADLFMEVPSGNTFEHRQTPRVGRAMVDERGVHLTCRWRGEAGAWEHGQVPAGVEIDAWRLSRLDERGNVVALVEFPGRP